LAAEPVSDETVAANFGNLAAAAPYFLPGDFQATFETGPEMCRRGSDGRGRSSVKHLLNATEIRVIHLYNTAFENSGEWP